MLGFCTVDFAIAFHLLKHADRCIAFCFPQIHLPQTQQRPFLHSAHRLYVPQLRESFVKLLKPAEINLYAFTHRAHLESQAAPLDVTHKSQTHPHS